MGCRLQRRFRSAGSSARGGVVHDPSHEGRRHADVDPQRSEHAGQRHPARHLGAGARPDHEADEWTGIVMILTVFGLCLVIGGLSIAIWGGIFLSQIRGDIIPVEGYLTPLVGVAVAIVGSVLIAIGRGWL